MKTLIAAALLLALAAPAHAVTCTGRVKIDVVTGNEGLNPKGTKILHVGDCVFADHARVLRTCPVGSRCRVEGDGDVDGAVEYVAAVTRIPAAPYPEDTRAVEKLKKLYKQCLLGPYPEEGAWKICDPATDMAKNMEDRGYCFRSRPAEGVIYTVRCH